MAVHDPKRKAAGNLSVPPFGLPLDNRMTHQLAAAPIQGPPYSPRWGFVAPWLRTLPKAYARVLEDGSIQKQTNTADQQWRQNFAKAFAQTVVTSPGKNANIPQTTAQDALLLRELRRRGYRV